MRTQTFISSMVGVVAAAAVAGSVNAAIVDPFTQTSDALNNNVNNVTFWQDGLWLGGSFNQRATTANPGYGGSTPLGGVPSSTRSQTGAGSWVSTFAGDRPNTGEYARDAFTELAYDNESGPAFAIDFSKIMIDVAFAGSTRNAGSYVNFLFYDVSFNKREATLNFTGSQLSASSLTIEFSKSQFVLTSGTSFDWNQVRYLIVHMAAAGATGAGQTWTATNFQTTAVPAPGAAALIGLAGAFMSRRRRN